MAKTLFIRPCAMAVHTGAPAPTRLRAEQAPPHRHRHHLRLLTDRRSLRLPLSSNVYSSELAAALLTITASPCQVVWTLQRKSLITASTSRVCMRKSAQLPNGAASMPCSRDCINSWHSTRSTAAQKLNSWRSSGKRMHLYIPSSTVPTLVHPNRRYFHGG